MTAVTLTQISRSRPEDLRQPEVAKKKMRVKNETVVYLIFC